MTVILMRHAAFKFDENLVESLTEKGEGQADSIGKQLAERGIVPDRIWHSYRKQAEQTAQRLADLFNKESGGREILLETKDWLADEKRLCEKPPEGKTVLIVAHKESFRPLALAFGAGWGEIPNANHCTTLVFNRDGSPVKITEHIEPNLG